MTEAELRKQAAQDFARGVAAERMKLTPTERLHEVTMAAMGRKPAEPESSVTITRNARGVFQFEVTVRGGDVDECYSLAENVVSVLAEQYPYPNGDAE